MPSMVWQAHGCDREERRSACGVLGHRSIESQRTQADAPAARLKRTDARIADLPEAEGQGPGEAQRCRRAPWAARTALRLHCGLIEGSRKGAMVSVVGRQDDGVIGSEDREGRVAETLARAPVLCLFTWFTLEVISGFTASLRLSSSCHCGVRRGNRVKAIRIKVRSQCTAALARRARKLQPTISCDLCFPQARQRMGHFHIGREALALAPCLSELVPDVASEEGGFRTIVDRFPSTPFPGFASTRDRLERGRQ